MIAPIDCMMRIHRPMGRFAFESSLVADVIVMCDCLSAKELSLSVFEPRLLSLERILKQLSI